MLRNPRFLTQIEEVVQKYEVSKFVGLFLRSLLVLVVKENKVHDKDMEKVIPLLAIVANEGIMEPVVSSCVRLLVKSLYEKDQSEDEDGDADMEVDDSDESEEDEKKLVVKKRDFVLKVLRFFNSRFPEEVDKGFNAELKV